MPFQFEAYRPDNGSILDLMQAGPRARANAARTAGDAQARAIVVQGDTYNHLAGSLGQIATGVTGQILQHQADAPRREMDKLQLDAAKREQAEDQALRALFSREEGPSAEELYKVVGPKRGTEILKGFSALRTENQKAFASTQELVGSVAGGILALPAATQADAYATARKNLIQRGLIRPEDAPEQFSPELLKQVQQAALSPKDQIAGEQHAATTAETARHNAEMEGRPVTGSPGTVIFDPKTRQPLFTVPKPEEHSAAYKEWTDAKATGYTGSFTQYQNEDANRHKSVVNVNAPGQPGGLDPDGVDFAATQYRVTGVMPPLGMSDRGSRAAIINAAAKQAKELKLTPAIAIQKQAAYKSDAASLTQIKRLATSAESFENKALGQADIVRALSNKVGRSQYPIINAAIMAGKTEIVGDKDASLLLNAISTFSAEYAKLIEGSSGSVAGSSDTSRAAAARLISAKMNKGTVDGALDLMIREMSLTRQGYDATINHITTNMGGAQPAMSPQQVAPTAAPNPFQQPPAAAPAAPKKNPFR